MKMVVMKKNGDKKYTISKLPAFILALLIMFAFVSCSPDQSTMVLCRVGINASSSRTLTATIDPLGSNIYYRTIYRGRGKFYSPNNGSNADYKRLIKTEGILLSQGLWEIQVVFSKEPKDHVTKEEAASLPTATSGVIYINLNTTSIAVTLDEGVGSAVISEYKLTGSVPENPSVEVTLMKYNGSSFDQLTGNEYNSFIKEGTLNSDTKVFSNTKTALPSGIYYAVLMVKSNSTIKFVDTIAFVVRKGLTTTIDGSCSEYGNTSSENSNYLHMVNTPSVPIENTPTQNGNNQIFVSGDTNNALNNLAENKVTVIVGNTKDPNSYKLDRVDNNISSQRINSPNANCAMNLNGTDVHITKAKQGNTGNENALITVLNPGITFTLFNNTQNVPSSLTKKEAKEAAFAYLVGDGSNPHVINRRLQANLDMNGSTLNIVGNGATEAISNGGILFVGPEIYHTNVKSTEKRQGTINFFGKGGNVILDGNVTMKGIAGISSWAVQKGSSDSNSIITEDLDASLTLLKGAQINATSDATSEKTNNEGNYAYGMALLCNGKGGKVDVTLRDGHIKTTASSGTKSAGIYLQDFQGKASIKISADPETNKGSTFNATNGNGIYLNNCSNGTIEITIDDSKMNCSTGAIRIEKCTADIVIRITNSSLTTSSNHNALEISNSNKVKVYVNDEQIESSPIEIVTPVGVEKRDGN